MRLGEVVFGSWNSSIMTWNFVTQQEKIMFEIEYHWPLLFQVIKNVVPGHHKMGQNSISVEPF